MIIMELRSSPTVLAYRLIAPLENIVTTVYLGGKGASGGNFVREARAIITCIIKGGEFLAI
jgi:hypothetical protein